MQRRDFHVECVIADRVGPVEAGLDSVDGVLVDPHSIQRRNITLLS